MASGLPFEKITAPILSFSETVSRFTEAIFPNDLYVPKPVKICASYLSHSSTALSFQPQHVNLRDDVFWQAAIVILIHPIFWNILGRFEHYTRLFSRLFGKPVIGVYALALWIFVAGCYRDALFVIAMDRQVRLSEFDSVPQILTGITLIIVGSILVLTSFYQLGMCGTYLGDYFGILMESRVTGFPFNILDHPMYDGSTLVFLGKAIL